MKICSKCKEPFDTTSSYCPPCHNIYQKKYYKLHPDSIKKSVKQRKKRIREFIKKIKSVPCADCKLIFPWYVMDFDHLSREDKEFNLSMAANKGFALEKIKKEIDKCEVVCANCHRIRTFKNHSELF